MAQDTIVQPILGTIHYMVLYQLQCTPPSTTTLYNTRLSEFALFDELLDHLA